jgi:hypothetical protein
MNDRYYKWLSADRMTTYQHVTWPKRVGAWTADETPVLCRSGAVPARSRPRGLPTWANKENAHRRVPSPLGTWNVDMGLTFGVDGRIM